MASPTDTPTPTHPAAPPTLVSAVQAADSARALAYFESLLVFETDCWDVQASMVDGQADFVLVDVRGEQGFAAGHVDGALNIPHSGLTEERLAAYPADTLFVVYCAGPHCNGADRAAIRLAGLGRPVKKMIGGVEGWRDEGFALTR